jgi:hypothetical protein
MLRRAYFAAITGALLLGHGSAPAAFGDPQIGLNFTAAVLRIDSNNFPPNSMMAAGPTDLVELINGRYSVFSKTDGSLLQTGSLNDFWDASGAGHSGPFAYDPRVLYDPTTQRWYASSADGSMASPANQSHFLFAISKTSDPTQGWTGFAIAADSNQTQWADFPRLGYNGSAVVLAADMFPVNNTGSTATTVTVLVLPKADLLSATPSVAGATRIEYAPVLTSCQPVVDLDKDSLPAYIWAARLSPNRAQRYAVSGPVTSPAISTAGYVGLTFYGLPPDAPQPGGKAGFTTYDQRFAASVVQVSGVVWGVQTVDSGAGRAAVRWIKVDEANNVLLQQGLISDSSLAYYYPSIAVNDKGDVVIGFSGSSQSTYMSAFADVGDTVNGLTTFGDPMLLKAGVATFQILDTYGRNRGGDYSATTLDPNDPNVFWTIQEYISATDTWATEITEITVPEPSVMLVLGLGLVAALLRRRRKVAREEGRRRNSRDERK